MTKTPGPGHNSGLTDEEREALAFHHSEMVRRQMEAIEPLADELKDAKADLSKLFKKAEAEGFPKKEIEAALKEAATPIFQQREKEFTRTIIRKSRGLVVGQLDMFDGVPKPSKDELDWESEGYRIGLRAGEPNPRAVLCPPGYDQAFMRGYHTGQERNGMLLAKAKEVLERRTQPFGGASDAETANEAEERDEDVAIDEAAKALRNSSFMDTAAPDDASPDVLEDELEQDEAGDDVVLDVLNEDEGAREPDTFMDNVREVLAEGSDD